MSRTIVRNVRQISLHFFCRSDLRIATERLDSRESEFPPTPKSVKVILKSTIKESYMSKVNCESVMPHWAEAEYALGKIIVHVFHQKRQEMESEHRSSEQNHVALDQVTISYDYFVKHADKYRQDFAEKKGQADFTSFDTIKSSFKHFWQIGELIESNGKYKLNTEGELYKFWEEQFGY